MSLWSRITNAFRGHRLNRELDEELASHIESAIEQGRNPAEARRAFGSTLRHRETSRDTKLVPWLDSLRADALFGLRRLSKTKVTSAAAILSLALAIGACTSAFRLIDALLLRPLPVAHPEQLYALSRHGIGWDGKPQTFDGWAYPSFRQMRALAKDQAELIAISYAERMDLTYGSDEEMEKAYCQYVSGSMFGSFGLRPSLGSLFTEADDLTPGAHPYAVLSNDYWKHRFGQDPTIIGRTFRMGENLYKIIGVVDEPFTGTEPGTMTDIFVPTMMHPYITRSDATVTRVLALLHPGVAIEPLRQKLQENSRAFEADRAKSFTGIPQQSLENYLNQTLLIDRAASGVSDLQTENYRPLAALGVLVALVLLISCVNVANLMTAQASARAREMALRVSIGAGRLRLVQLVLLESAWIALLAAVLGSLFAWWSAPFVVSMINPPDNPARLFLPADGRVFGFSTVLTIAVTCLFGLLPALRASDVKPVSSLKGGEDPHFRRRLIHALVAVQVAFCFLVLFVAGLFVATFQRLSHESTGFSAERILTLDTFAQRAQPPAYWSQVTDHLRAVPGVESVALGSWALLGGNSVNSFISVNGAPPSPTEAYFLRVSPGWLDTLKISFVDGRDFIASDTAPGMAIVNETFAKIFFNGVNPVGKTFARAEDEGARFPFRIVGLVRDVRYRNMREPILPVAFVPFQGVRPNGAWQPQNWGTFIVRTSSANPLALAQTLRREVPRTWPEFRVSRIRTQMEINLSHTVRERLLAMLALFFAIVALLLASVGLYGVLHYSVVQRRREIAIRIAVGAQVGVIARLVTVDVFSMVFAGALAGLALGMMLVRYLAALFYQVKATDFAMLAFPSLAIFTAALLAALPAVVHAVRTDPVAMLRAE
jgi:putative ABC transport system permease protein